MMRPSKLAILSETLADAVMDRPREFFIDSKRFCLWSPSLGMSLMAERHLTALKADREFLMKKPALEIMRLVSNERKGVCDFLAIHTLRSKRSLSDSRVIGRRSDYLSSHLDDEELSQLMMVVLSWPNAETIINHTPLVDQQQQQERISRIKQSPNTLTFGGVTIFGSLIAPAMSAFHLSYDQVVWGISLLNLRILLTDKINSVYLSDEEAKMLSEYIHVGMSVKDFEDLKKEFCD